MKRKIIIIILIFVFCFSGAFYSNKLIFHKSAKTLTRTTYDLDRILTKEEALEDIDFIMNILKKYHPAWIENGSKLPELVKNKYKAIVEKFCDSMTVAELWKAAGSILHVMHDAHTRIGYYDTQLFEVEDASIFKDSKIVSIDNIPFEDVIATINDCSSYEMDNSIERMFIDDNLFLFDTYLQLAGIDTTDGVDYAINRNGTEINYHSNMIRCSNDQKDFSFVSYNIDRMNSIGLFTLTSCIVNQEYTKTLDSFFSEVLKNNIKNIVIDLRDNGGGNSTVARKFLEYIDVNEYYYSGEAYFREGKRLVKLDNYIKNEKQKQTFKGNIYVLTSYKTFSAATMFAAMITDNHLGTLVGETSSNNPTCYSDIKEFKLPKSNLYLATSTSHINRIDRTKISEFLVPDYVCKAREALVKVYNLIKG